MTFYLYSAVLPIAIIAALLWFYRPLNFQRVTKALTITIIPLVLYTSLIYFLETGNYIDSGWAYWTLVFFFIPYLVVILILNGVAWNKRRRVQA